MNPHNLTRRQVLRATALLGTAALINIPDAEALLVKGKTPPLSATEIAAIETEMGKKGTYKEAEATHTTPLPRNDLKVTIKGEAVPIPFGFGGWVSIKKTVDGKTAMLMSDTVLLQEEVNLLISAAHANGLEVSAIHNHFFTKNPASFTCTCTAWVFRPTWLKNLPLPLVKVNLPPQINSKRQPRTRPLKVVILGQEPLLLLGKKTLTCGLWMPL